jgi:hypothetical protein
MPHVDRSHERNDDRPAGGVESERLDYVIDDRPVGDFRRERSDARGRAPMPFVWQHDTRVLLLDDEEEGWVMAELRFDPEVCRYQEVRRANYRLTREAIGAVLSRALASGDHAAVDMALSLHEWMHTYYGITVVPHVIPSPDASSIEFSL